MYESHVAFRSMLIIWKFHAGFVGSVCFLFLLVWHHYVWNLFVYISLYPEMHSRVVNSLAEVPACISRIKL